MSIYSTARGTDSAWNITHTVIQHFNLLAFSIIKENNQEFVFTLNWERIIWKKDASRIDKQTYQLTVLESIKHFKVSTALKSIKVRYMFPEPIDSSQGQKPLRVNFPCIPERWEKETVKKLQKKNKNQWHTWNTLYQKFIKRQKGVWTYFSSIRFRPPSDILSQCEGSALHFSKKSTRISAACSPW